MGGKTLPAVEMPVQSKNHKRHKLPRRHHLRGFSLVEPGSAEHPQGNDNQPAAVFLLPELPRFHP